MIIPSQSKRKPIKFKPYKIPKDFVLLVDTREQKPLFTRIPSGLTIVSKTLKHGDYSIKGFENKITVERKQMSDLMQYIGKDRLSTVKKLTALKPFFFKGLVIETNNLYLLPMYTQVTIEMVRAFIVSVEVRYGLHIYCSNNRQNIERWIMDRLLKSYNILREV